MTTRVLNCNVTIGGVDFSAHVTNIGREHFICRPVGLATIRADAENAPACSPGDAVSILEMGVQRFTGYVADHGISHAPAERIIECQDEMKRLVEYQFVDTSFISNGQTITYWIEYFLDLVGVASHDVAITTQAVPTGIEFRLESVMEIVRKLCNVKGWQMYADANGTVHIGDFLQLGLETLLINKVRVSALLSDSWLRNHIVVFGQGGAKGEVIQAIPELGDETRSAVLANPYIPTQADAQTAAEDMAPYFQTPLDTKEITYEGPEIVTSLLDTVAVNDDYCGYVMGLVTGVESSFDVNGYLVSLYLNERCPGFWGVWQVGEGRPIYLGLNHTALGSGKGVWKTKDYKQWSNVSFNLAGNELNVNAVTINPFIGGEVWVCTPAGVFKKTSTTWVQVSMDDPTNSELASPAPVEADIDWLAIEFDIFSPGTIYVLGATSNRAWVFKTATGGLSWSSYQIRRYT